MPESVLKSETAWFPIRELSARTKVNTVTIRAWERRYGLLKPERTPKGHRLYSEADVNRIEQVLALIARGVPVGKVKALLGKDAPEPSPDLSDTWQQAVKRLIESATALSPARIDAQIGETFLNYPPALCRERLVEPAMDSLQNSDSLAAYYFAQSEIVRYALSRTGTPGKKNKGKSMLLVCGEHTPMWRLALLAIELADAGFAPQLINQPCNVAGWVQIAQASHADHCLVYQDGVWREEESTLIVSALPGLDGLILCGTAPMVSGLKANDRLFPDPQKVFEYFKAKVKGR